MSKKYTLSSGEQVLADEALSAFQDVLVILDDYIEEQKEFESESYMDTLKSIKRDCMLKAEEIELFLDTDKNK